LVCDDDADILDVVSEMLTELGYRPIGARTGSQILERAAQEQPAVILLDLSMPGASGWETLQLLKDSPVTREIPVVILSGFDPTGNEPDGHVGWLAKPVGFDALRTVLQRVLERVVPAA
jgi:CheY-like chemotaxis protein